MADLPIPQQCTAVAMIVGNCQQQLCVLAQAYGRNDLRDEIPRLTSTARHAAKLARDMLVQLLEQLGDEPKKPRRKPRKNNDQP